LAESYGREDGTSLVVDTRLTQGDLAAMVGASRETVNKCMGAYERQGIVRYRRGRITILDAHRLRRRIAY
jgi:CRP-like cAMP-binding protein